MASTNLKCLPPSFSIYELAEELNISVRTLNRWHDMRTGPARIKVGGKIFYRLSKVEEWLAQNELDPHKKGGSNDN